MWFKINFWSCFIFTFLALKSFTCGLRITFGFVLYSHFWHWKFYISTEINFWFCFIITFLTLKCYTFMFGLYMCFETTCEMILMLCVDILLWRNILYRSDIRSLYAILGPIEQALGNRDRQTWSWKSIQSLKKSTLQIGHPIFILIYCIRSDKHLEIGYT